VGSPVVTVVKATRAHALEMAANLREADAAEVLALGAEPAEGLLASVDVSDIALTALFDGEVACMAGVVRGKSFLPDEVGLAWLLTAKPCAKHPRALVRVTKELMPWLQEESGCVELRNWVDARYTGALRLLERLGFVQGEARAMGPQGLPFILVSRRA
jgi:hypothetical protein